MLRRWWNYIQTWFGMRSDEAMDPQVEIEAAIDEARQHDKVLRNEAAKVIAHRTRVADEVEEASKEVAEARELAKQALVKADEATRAANAAEARKWTAAAQSIALRLRASQRNVEAMQQQLVLADGQAQQAQSAVRSNAMRLEEVTAQRMQVLGQLQAARMQETVDKAMATISAEVGGDVPSLDEIEDRIQDRMAVAAAQAQLDADAPGGARAGLERSVDLSSADATLDDLRAELGLDGAPEVPAAPEPTPLPSADVTTTVSGSGTSSLSSTDPAPTDPATTDTAPAPPPPAPPPVPPSGTGGAPT
jgi:phage shock protein A